MIEMDVWAKRGTSGEGVGTPPEGAAELGCERDALSGDAVGLGCEERKLLKAELRSGIMESHALSIKAGSSASVISCGERESVMYSLSL